MEPLIKAEGLRGRGFFIGGIGIFNETETIDRNRLFLIMNFRGSDFSNDKQGAEKPLLCARR